MLRGIQNSLLSLIYPQECRVCGAAVEGSQDGVVCRDCWTSTHIFTGKEMLCNKCGAFFADEAAIVAVYCHKCDGHFYDRAVAVGIYEKALAASIIHLKTAPVLAETVKQVITATLERSGLNDGTDLIIPIPLSRQRKHERGFNQAVLIAAAIASSTGFPVDALSLSRKLHTPIHRVGMDKKAREITVKNAFEVVRPKLIEGKHILLVDDVFTSGATASSCAKVLKKNGSVSVNVFTLARAVMH